MLGVMALVTQAIARRVEPRDGSASRQHSTFDSRLSTLAGPLLLVTLATLSFAPPGHAASRFRQPQHDLLGGKTRPVVVINVPARLLRAYAGGKLVFQCPVAIGRYRYPGLSENTLTRLGSYRIDNWATGYVTKEHPVSWKTNAWQGAFGVHTALLGPDALYQHLHGTVGPLELGDWIVTRTIPRERRPDESEREYRKYLDSIEYGLSHGCVRVSNANIGRLRAFCPRGTEVHKIYALEERYVVRKPGDIARRDFPNVYRYEDIANGAFWPERGLLVGYHHPDDNEHLGPALPRSED